MKVFRLTRNQTLFALLSLAALATMTLSYFRVFELYELQTYDWRYQLRGLRSTSPRIVHIDISDDALQAVGSWPFPRINHAALIQALRQFADASAVTFDIVFVEEQKEDDLYVATYAKRAGNVYFSQAFREPKLVDGKLVSDTVIAPLVPSFARAAKRVGFINVTADIDGKRRRMPAVIYYQGKPYYHMVVGLAMDLLGVKDEDVKLAPGALKLGDKVTIPLDDDQNMIANFAGKWSETFQHYSYAHLLAANNEILDNGPDKRKMQSFLSKLKGKVCIVGYTATASTDVNATPLERIYPMVGIHSNALNMILQKDFIVRANRLTNALIALILAVLVLWVSLTKKPLFAFRFTGLILVLFTSFALFSFAKFGLWIDLFYPFVAIAGFFAASVVARTIREMRRREVIEKELAIASQIQLSFLPETVPQEAGLSIDVFMKPAKAVGGDLYGFVPLEGGKIGVMVGDVSGKGTPAALFMAKIVSEFKFSSMGEFDPSAALTKLNDKVSSERTGGLFVTMAYAIFDPAARKMRFSNGGHLPVVSVSAAGESKQLEADGGMPVGVMAGVPFMNAEVDLRPGDCFALYSDGVSEARNRKSAEWGIEALEACVKEFRARPAAEILKATLEKLTGFMYRAEQHDDITLMVIKVQ